MKQIYGIHLPLFDFETGIYHTYSDTGKHIHQVSI